MTIIILNDYEYAKQMLDEKSLGRTPYATLLRVAKYYIDIDKCQKNALRKKLETFLIQCNPEASLPKWADMIDHVISDAYKREAVEIDSINITKSEMDIIHSVNGRQAKRLIFTLLCLAKYWNIVNSTNSGWVNTKGTDIMKLANISTSLKRQGALYNDLIRAGLLKQSSKVDNTNVQVTFISEDEEEIVIKISDFRNLGYQYMMYCGEPYYTCENCGITSKKKAHSITLNNDRVQGRKPKYCEECARKIKIQQTINSVMNKRNSLFVGVLENV